MRQPHGLPARQVGFFAQTLGKVVYLCFILLCCYQLTPHHESRYSLVIAVSKRARQIAAQAKERGIIITEKPVKTAINEIASGKVIIVESQEQD